MATLADIGNFYNVSSGILFERFLGGVLRQIVVIRAEDSRTANHAARLVWANAKLAFSKADLAAEAERQLRLAVAGNPAIQAALNDTTDNDIQYVIDQQVGLDIA
jgi:hypothetical protein